jgi:hypothetical protein
MRIQQESLQKSKLEDCCSLSLGSTLYQKISSAAISKHTDDMDSLIDLSEPSKALDLSRIRFQLM